MSIYRELRLAEQDRRDERLICDNVTRYVLECIRNVNTGAERGGGRREAEREAGIIDQTKWATLRGLGSSSENLSKAWASRGNMFVRGTVS